MQRQTFIDHMKKRGYDIIRTGNIKTTKENITIRLMPLASHGVHTTAKNATDTETLQVIGLPTIQT